MKGLKQTRISLLDPRSLGLVRWPGCDMGASIIVHWFDAKPQVLFVNELSGPTQRCNCLAPRSAEPGFSACWVDVVTWEDVRHAFEWDGSWRDIYVVGVGPSGWHGFWRLVNASRYRVQYRVDGVPAPPPAEIELVFALREIGAPVLSVFLDTIQLNCHFFDDQDIELDLDPREVTTQLHLDLVLAFMRDLGAATRCNVVLTPENLPTAPVFRYEVKEDALVHIP